MLGAPRERVRRRVAHGSWLVGLVGLIGFGLGLNGCFHGETLAYVACTESDSCAEAGLLGCLRPGEAAGVRGLCTLACEADVDCPAARDGEAPARCAEVAGAKLCVLSCMDEETCPESQVCTRVGGVDGGAADLCFPAGEDAE